MPPQAADHGGIVRAVFLERKNGAVPGRDRGLEAFAKRAVAGDAAGKHDGPDVEILRGVKRLSAQHVHDGLLIGCQDVEEDLVADIFYAAEVLHVVEQRGLHAAETEVETIFRRDGLAGGWRQRTREVHRVRIALFREAFDHGAAGVAQVQDLRRFVEGLARGIVERGPRERHLPVAPDHDQRGMAAGHDDREHREEVRVAEFDGILFEERPVDVRGEMVDRDQRKFV